MRVLELDASVPTEREYEAWPSQPARRLALPESAPKTFNPVKSGSQASHHWLAKMPESAGSSTARLCMGLIMDQSMLDRHVSRNLYHRVQHLAAFRST